MWNKFEISLITWKLQKKIREKKIFHPIAVEKYTEMLQRNKQQMY